MKVYNYRVFRMLSILLILLMAVIVLDVLWQVFTRFILQKPSSFTEELAGFLLVWIGILGASHALYTKSHLGIDFIAQKFRGIRKRVLEILIYSIIILFAFFVMVLGGLKLVTLTFRLNQVSAALGVKIGYVYLVLPFSGVLMMLYSLGFLLESVRREGE